MASIPSLMALRCFDASAQHRSFTKAARFIHITQGAVSHQVLALEDMLGVRLFDRRHAGLQLTPAGLAYWRQINSCLSQLDRATQELRMSKGEGGVLNLSVPSTFGTYWLVPRLPAFTRAHRDIKLNLSTRVGPADFDGPAAPDASIDFCTGESPRLMATKLCDLEMRLCVAPALLPAASRGQTDLPKSTLVELLTRHPLIRHTTVPLAWPGWLEQAGLLGELEPGVLAAGPQHDLFSMAMNATIAELGVALLPRFATREALESGQLAEISGVAWVADKSYYLRYPHANSCLPALQTLSSWLVGLADREPLDSAPRQAHAIGREG